MKTNIKSSRLAKTIQKYITDFLLREHSEIFTKITITEVVTTGDLGIATVYYTVAKDISRISIAQKMNKIKNAVRNDIAHKLKIKQCPQIIFQYDKLIESANRIESLIRENKNSED